MRLVACHIQRASRPRPSVFVELVDAEGRTGKGEAAPLPPFSREGASEAARAIGGARRIATLDESRSAAEAVASALEPIAGALASAPSARFALETALLDLLAQRRGTSIAAILGGAGAYDRVPLNALLAAPPLETLPTRAAALAAEGFTAIKIKLRARDDGGFAREVEALREVRALLPPPFELRLDPNGAWSIDEARRKLEALVEIAPRFVEQPVAAAELHRLGECAVPWAADESLADEASSKRFATARGCAAFVLKPHVLGLLRARELSIAAQAHGIDVVVTHFFDGPHAMAAACELASSLPRPPLACGLAPHQHLAAFAANFGGVEIPQLAEQRFARSSGGPGLGVRSTWVGEGHG